MQGLWLASLALLALGSALWLFQVADRRQREQRVNQYVEAQIERQQSSRVAESAEDAAPDLLASQGVREDWDNILLRAGIASARAYTARAVLLMVSVVAVCALLIGPWQALFALVLLIAGLALSLWMKIDKRRNKMTEQLPDFLETMVRLITIGNGMGTAFQTAATSVQAPLLDLMERAHQLTRVGVEIDTALHQVARLYRFKELELVAAVVGVAMRFGGRSDQVLERMAGFMRDLQQARQELFAMSAEVRLSAWILALLPVGVAALILVANNELFMTMWEDSLGKMLLFAAVGLQALGSFLLYKMAKAI